MKIVNICLILLTFGCQDNFGSMKITNLFYIPIGVETYVPITVENIEEAATKKGSLDLSSKVIKQILSFIDVAEPGIFDNESIRVKLVLSNDSLLYIDNRGGVLIGKISKSLNKETLSQVKSLIESQFDQSQGGSP